MTFWQHHGRRFASLAFVPFLIAGGPVFAQADAASVPLQAADTTPKHELPPVSAKNRAAAEELYLKGAKALSAGSFTQAQDEFARAVVLDPAKPEYLAAVALAREHRVTDLLQQSARDRDTNPAAADALLAQARSLDATNPRVTQHDSLPVVAQVALPGLTPVRSAFTGTVKLRPNGSKHAFHERNDIRVLAAHMTEAYGIQVRLDPDVQTRQFRVDVDDASFDDAMRVLNLVTETMYVPLDAHTVVLAQDTAQNRTRYERMVEETYYLPGFTADQLKDFVSIAQQVLEIKQVSVEPGLGTIVVRGPEDLVNAADVIFTDLLAGGTDVVIDMKLYTVDKSRTRNLGVILPTGLSAYSLASEAQSIVSQNSSLVTQLIAQGLIPSSASTVEIAAYLVFVGGLGNSSSLLTNTFLLFGGGLSTGALSATITPALNMALTQSDARMLENLQLRVSNKATAIFKSGTRYPIQTSLFSDIASSTTTALNGLTVNGQSLSSLISQYLGNGSSLGNSAVVPQVQYEDLGLVVTAVPTIERSGDVSMHLEAKVTSLAGTSLNGIPVLSSQQFSSDLTVKNGETTMMMSSISESELTSVSGIPGLSELPGFQSTTNKNSTKTTSELVLLITPHIARYGHTSAIGPYIPLQPRPDAE